MESALRFQEALRRDWAYLGLGLLLLAAVYYPVLSYMALQWYVDPNYSHGFIVPLISGYLLHQKWGSLKDARVSGSAMGLGIVIAGLVLLTIGYLGTEYFTMRISFIVVLAGMVVFLFGGEVMRGLRLPLVYLFFMVPLPYIVYDAMAFPLKLIVAKYSVMFLKLIGIMVWREGNIIMFPNIELEVADACSGIRSLVSLLAIGVVFAYLSQRSNLKRAVIVVLAVPVAVFANAVRVIATGILAKYFGAAAAEGFFHEFAGLAVFGLSIVMLVAVSLLIRKVGHDK